MKKFLALMLVVILLITVLVGCANKNEETSEDFTLAYGGVSTLSPTLTQESNSHNILYLTQVQLIRYYGGAIQNDAAESYDMNEDATVFTFYLRDGLKWSDDTPLSAQDFVYGLYCLLAPEMGSPRANSWYAIKNAKSFSEGQISDWNEVGVKALDEKTVEFTLEYSLNSFDDTIACKHIYPIKREFVDNIGIDKLGSSPETSLYSGAYIVKDWVPNNSLELVKNSLYWDSNNSFPTKNIHFIEVTDANTQIAMFESGEVDAVAGVESQYYDKYEGNVKIILGGEFEFLWFNQKGTSEETAKLLGNLNFRQALNYSINREAVALAASKANEAANYIIDPNFVGPGGGKFIDEYPIDSVPVSGDVNKAKEYLNNALEELGYTDVSMLPELKIVTFPYDRFKLECETIIDHWKQNLGLTCFKLTQYEVGTAIETFYSLDYNIFCISWETDVRPTDIMQALMTGGEANAGIWSNSEFDALVAQAINEPDSIKQAQMIQQAQQIFTDDAGIVPLYVCGSIQAVKPYVEGYQVGVVDGFEFNNLIVRPDSKS